MHINEPEESLVWCGSVLIRQIPLMDSLTDYPTVCCHFYWSMFCLFVCLFCHSINWRIFALQNFVVFCHTSRISHRCIYVSSLLNLPSSKHVLTAQLTYSVRSVSDQNRRLVTMFPKEWTKLVRAPGLKIIKHCFSMSLMVMIARADLVCMLTFSQGPLTKPHEKSKNLWT